MKKRLFSLLVGAVLLAVSFVGAAAQSLVSSQPERATPRLGGGEVPGWQATPGTPSPTPTPPSSGPASVDRNLQLVIGAVLLVLIVIGGVAWASMQEAKRH